jgi:hypothetical protein
VPRRTQTFIKSPWTGGLNSLIDPGMLPDNDLVIAENVIFSASGARIKREGREQFDAASNIPAVTHYSSSGTTRTLTFASALYDTDFDKLCRGERITITSTDATLNTNYGGTFYINDIPTSTTITYTHTGGSITIGSTASSSFTVSRATDYIDIRDYWRMNVSSTKTHYIMALSGQGKLFRFNPADGKRVEITRPPEKSTVLVTNGDTANNTNGDWFKIRDKNGSVGVYMKTSGGADTPPTGLADRVIQVPYATGASANTIAAAIQVAMDADAQFVATVNTATVTITDAFPGERGDIEDGTASGGSNPTGWTFAILTVGQSITAPFDDSPTLQKVQSTVLNERYILAPNDNPIYYHPETNEDYYYDLAGSPPKCNAVSEHLGRLWINDITNRDRLHYSTTGEPEEWQGVGDSGALDIGWGDGDPEGIIAISPAFKGRIFVGKATKIYQITGEEPLTFFPQPITSGLGVAGNKSFCAVNMDDLFFVSKEGVHSVTATSAHGDYESSFLSQKIQTDFDNWPQNYLYKIAPIYVPLLNAVLFNVPETGATEPSALWLYDVDQKAWFTWPDWAPIASCNYLTSVNTKKFMFADGNGKIFVLPNGDYTDSDGAGGTTAYRYKIKTGTIYVDGNPQTIKGYKNISFLFRPTGRYSFVLKVYIDNLPVQTKTFSQGVSGDVLGTDFYLGSSVLGTSLNFAPNTIPIEGYGRGISFQIENNISDEQVEIYGFIIEYEGADISAEVSE